MAKLTFRGGVHPYDGKDLSKDKPMKTIVPKGEWCIHSVSILACRQCR